jgi:hypothetical protein
MGEAARCEKAAYLFLLFPLFAVLFIATLLFLLSAALALAFFAFFFATRALFGLAIAIAIIRIRV